MIIKSIILKDFRQYKGKQEIKFSTGKEKNVTVILGLNTSGKTTIIEAFKWCLYKETNYLQKDLINKETIAELGAPQDVETYVEITLIHSNIEYIIRRTQNYFKSLGGKSTAKKDKLSLSYKDEKGKSEQVRENESGDIINTILPSELSDYFFFDGERIGDIGNRSDIKNAVQGLMGLDVITEAKNRLDPNKANTVTSRFESRLDIGSDKSSEKLTKDIADEQDKLEKYRNNMLDVEKELKDYKRVLRQTEEKISANKDVRDKQIERTKIEKGLKKDKSRLAELNKRIRKEFSSKAINFFSIPLIDKAAHTLDNTEEEVEGIKGMNASSIDHIINRGTCICGNDLKHNEEARGNILYEKKLLPPYHIGTMVSETKKSYEYIEDRGYKFEEDIMMDISKHQGLKDEIEDSEKDLENINKELIDDDKVGELDFERSKYKDKIKDLNNKRDTIIRSIGSADNKIDTLKKRKESLAITSDRNKEVYKCIAYSKALYNYFKDNYKKREKIVKDSLQKNVNEIFDEIYHGKRYVKIDDNYKVTLDTMVNEGRTKTDMSKGLEAVKNFSFVAGLVKIAKEKVKGEDDMDIEEPYPLVMDAPFSNIDEIHIANISKVLPKVSEQVIWILMEKDWNYAKDSLSDRIGYLYEIEKVNNSETYSKMKGRKLNV